MNVVGVLPSSNGSEAKSKGPVKIKALCESLKLSSLLVVEEKSLIDDGVTKERRNLLIGGDALKDVDDVKALLCKQFDMKDLGELRYFLGIEMIRSEGGIWLSQKKYGLDMLMKYSMADCKSISTPLDQNLKLRIDEGEVEIQVQDLVVIYCDNLNSIQLARNLVFHVCTKHIQVHYHFIRERVLNGDIDLAYVDREDQAADLFTKALGAEKLQRFRGMLGLRDLALSLRGSVEISSSMST
ncbi:hypothetical protein L7F22_064524 [Adiantum nelumboides]|nr:hypothetical protein [Adiantum nelumboides]